MPRKRPLPFHPATNPSEVYHAYGWFQEVPLHDGWQESRRCCFQEDGHSHEVCSQEEQEEVKKPIWDKKRPSDLGKPKKLTSAKKSAAKAAAKKAGRPYPNLIDNMQAARKNK
jgi:hypothetical protein